VRPEVERRSGLPLGMLGVTPAWAGCRGHACSLRQLLRLGKYAIRSGAGTRFDLVRVHSQGCRSMDRQWAESPHIVRSRSTTTNARTGHRCRSAPFTADGQWLPSVRAKQETRQAAWICEAVDCAPAGRARWVRIRSASAPTCVGAGQVRSSSLGRRRAGAAEVASSERACGPSWHLGLCPCPGRLPVACTRALLQDFRTVAGSLTRAVHFRIADPEQMSAHPHRPD
jgi:hypothetical protein